MRRLSTKSNAEIHPGWKKVTITSTLKPVVMTTSMPNPIIVSYSTPVQTLHKVEPIKCPLNSSEIHILELVAKHLASREIAKELGVLKEEIDRWFTYSIFPKCHTTTRRGAVRYARKKGWIR